MITYYYDMGKGIVYYSDYDIDYRILSRSVRCIQIEFGNAKVIKDTHTEWQNYPMDDGEITWMMLKAKKIPRSWDQFNIQYMDDWTSWTKWEKKFLWWPKKLNGKWYWLRTYYERERLLLWYSQRYEYDYALNLFDIIKKT